MPELPEVEIVRRRLAACLPGLVVGRVVVNDAKVSDLGEDELRTRLEGRRVLGLRRRGKHLIVDLDGSGKGGSAGSGGSAGGGGLGGGEGDSGGGGEGDAVTEGAAARAAAARTTAPVETVAVIHLRMTGQLLFRPEPGSRPARFVWYLEPHTELHFQDVRRFGRLTAFDPAHEAAFFAAMGPEPFDDGFDVTCLRAALAGRRAPLKSFLIDQRRIAGVGNIYADEALFRARLHPLRAAGSVGPREAARLHAALLETLQAGIDHEGSSIESFVDPAGERGGFQEILNVYQRTGEACRVCAAAISRTVVGGRGTHFCPRCQPRRTGKTASVRRPS